MLGFALLILGLEGARRRWSSRSLRRRQWYRAEAAEAEAPRILQALGYQVLGAQVPGSYVLTVDGEPLTVALRADFLVCRGGQHFVAEVKSGQQAPRIGTAATRRQLLEYLIAFQVDGVLLVNGETQEVHQVGFPVDIHGGTPPEQPNLGLSLGAALLGLAAALYVAWLSISAVSR